MGATVSVEGMSYSYGRKPALLDLSFTLEDDKIYGLLGRNGSGKTTMLSVLAAFLKPSAGRVLVDGRPVWEDAEAMSGICLIRSPCDTVGTSSRLKEALILAADTRPNWDQRFADELMDLFDLDPKRSVGSLSTGQCSALGVVLGLASRAPLTMLDESYLGLDAPARRSFYDVLLADFMARPRTILLSTHLIEEVAQLFEDVLIIDRGRLLVHERTDELVGRGVTLTGPSTVVDEFVAGLPGVEILSDRRLGPTKATALFGTLDANRRAEAASAGLDIEAIGLQDLFIHLTAGDVATEERTEDAA